MKQCSLMEQHVSNTMLDICTNVAPTETAIINFTRNSQSSFIAVCAFGVSSFYIFFIEIKKVNGNNNFKSLRQM